jgi:hypothetical protein
MASMSMSDNTMPSFVSAGYWSSESWILNWSTRLNGGVGDWQFHADADGDVVAVVMLPPSIEKAEPALGRKGEFLPPAQLEALDRVRHLMGPAKEAAWPLIGLYSGLFRTNPEKKITGSNPSA